MKLSRRDALRAITVAVGGAVLEACGTPRARQRPSASALNVPSSDQPRLRTAYGPAEQQFGDLRLPAGPGPHPVVIVVHGGFWQAGYGLDLMDPACEALRREGFATWNIEYRRLGDAGGGWPGTFLDVAAATEHVRVLAETQPLDLTRVVTFGHSAGGQLSLWIPARRWIREGELFHPNPLRVRGAVSLAGVVDLRRAWSLGFDVVGRLMGGSPEEYPGRYDTGSPAELLPLGVPQVLVHGRDDRIVPVDLSSGYQAEAVRRGDEAKLVPLPAVGHFELIEPGSSAWPEVVQVMRALA